MLWNTIKPRLGKVGRYANGSCYDVWFREHKLIPAIIEYMSDMEDDEEVVSL